MAIKIQLYGQLKQIAGASEITLEAADTDGLMKSMIARFPSLENMGCLVAVDRNIIQKNTIITDAHELALLPPYSGG
jgi:molybdopterin converting factor small subunit